jgi:sporulation protein YlmC with PRC-barrel domain
MDTEQEGLLIHLSRSELELADPDADVRGHKVVDRYGDDVGKVEDLVIDPEERKVRFLLVGAGGFLGIGEQKLLVPVDAVTSVDDRIHIDQEQPQLSDAPVYDPSLIEEPDYYENLYSYYGYPPHWSSGYVYPPFPPPRL